MERVIDGKIYPEMSVVFHRQDDGSNTTVMTIDISGVPIGFTVIHNNFIDAIINKQ